MKMALPIPVVLVLAFALQACGGGESPLIEKQPVALTDDAVGHFCGMQVSDHDGPKGQVFLKGADVPLWFVSVRDSLAFSRMPDEQFRVRTIYVSDMGKAASWEQPGDVAWVRAEDAWYVAGSARQGGMNMAEFVPFSEKTKAESFIVEYGGTLTRLDEISTDDLMGSGDTLMNMEESSTVND